MSRTRASISMSLDGYAAGPRPTEAEPLGIGGEQLHEWVVGLRAWRESHGLDGGTVNESSRIIEEMLADVGATIMGRNMFGGGPGPWRTPAWNGWWGDEPPFHHPVFVLTHHARAPLVLKGGTTFHFVTDGADAALAQARAAAGDKDVAIGGGAKTIQQYLAAGVLDELVVSVVPVLLGGGSPLFGDLGEPLPRLRQTETVVAPGVTHLRVIPGGVG